MYVRRTLSNYCSNLVQFRLNIKCFQENKFLILNLKKAASKVDLRLFPGNSRYICGGISREFLVYYLIKLHNFSTNSNLFSKNLWKSSDFRKLFFSDFEHSQHRTYYSGFTGNEKNTGKLTILRRSIC